MKLALLIKTKNLGDAVILTSSICALREQYRVHILCFSDCIAFYDGLDGVEKVWFVKRGQRGLASVSNGLKILLGMREFEYDLLIQFSDDWRGAWLARLLKSRISVAHNRMNRPSIWLNSFKKLAPLTPRRHAVDQDVDLLRSVGAYRGPAPPYQLPKKLLIENYQIKATSSATYLENYIVLHLFSRWTFKQIPAELSRNLITHLIESGMKILITGDVNDEYKYRDLHLKRLDGLDTLFGSSLSEFVSAINSSKALISIDSLALHVASAMKVPTVGIFGPSGEHNWSPRETKHIIVENSALYPCRPCGKDGCGGSKVSQCLEELTVESIVTGLHGVLK